MFMYRTIFVLLALLVVFILSVRERDPLPRSPHEDGLPGALAAMPTHKFARERMREERSKARDREMWASKDEMRHEGANERRKPASSRQKRPVFPGVPSAAAAETQEENKRRLLSRLALRERLEHAFPYNPAGKFPAYIWQTWKVTPASGDFDNKLRPLEASWTEMHPSFTHRVIDDNTALPLLKTVYGAHFPELIDAYKALPLPVLRADFFRYLILLARGGIYSDIDTFILKPATSWLPRHWTRLNEHGEPREKIGLLVGVEADATDRADWNDWYSRRVQFCQWTIMAKRGHPVLRDIVANITEKTLALRSRVVRERINEINDINEKADADLGQIGLTPDDLDQPVVEFTGPALWTDAVFRYFHQNVGALRDAKTLFGRQGKYAHHHESPNVHVQVTADHFAKLTNILKLGDVAVLPITSFSPGVGHMGAGDEDDDMAFVKHDFEGM